MAMLEPSFEALISSYLDHQVGIDDFFISENLASSLSGNLNKLFEDNQMKMAGTGNENIVLVEKSIRSDSIYWLDRSHNDVFENEFLDLMDRFVLYLNQTCYTGITSYEFHYARYDVGSFYKRHLDRFKSDNSRQFSIIVYLNKNWISSDGGELVIYHMDRDQNISPMFRKLVFFKSSDLEHEVLMANVPRLSITGWLKRD